MKVARGLLAGVIAAATCAGPSRAAHGSPERVGQVSTVTVASQGVWIGAQDPWQITLTTPTAMAEPSILVTFGAVVDALDDLTDPELAISGAQRTLDIVPSGNVLMGSLAGRGTGAAGPTVPRLDVGVHPVRIVVSDGDSEQSTIRTWVVRLPDEPPAAALSVAVLSQLIPDPILQPDSTFALQPATLDNVVRTTALLSAAPPATVSVLPSGDLVDALAQLADPAAITALTTAIATQELVLGPYVPIDEALWIALDRARDIAALRARANRSVQTLIPSHTATDVDVLDATAGPDTVRSLAEIGITDLLVRRENLVLGRDRDDDDPPPTAVRLAGSASTRVIDERFGRIPTTGDPLVDSIGRVAELAFIWSEEPDRNRAIAVDVTDDERTEITATTIRLLQQSSIIVPTTVDGLFDVSSDEPETATLRDDPSVPVGNFPSDRDLQLERIVSYEGMIGGAQPLTAGLRDLLDVSLANALSPTNRSRYVAAAADAIDRGTSGISVEADQGFNLTSRDATIGIQIANGLGITVLAQISLDAETRLEFPDGAVLTAELAPGENVIDVRVHVRSAGRTPLTVRITTPDGRVPLAEGTVSVRSTVLTGVGIILGVGAIGVLGVWWARQFRRRRTTTLARAPGPPRGRRG